MTTTRPRVSVLAPLRHRNYRLLFAAMVLELFASGAWSIYLVLEALALDATASALSSVVTWTGIGLLAMSLVGGVVADRMPKKLILVGVLTLNLATALVIAILSFTGNVHLWQLSVSAFVMGATAAFLFPAYTALVPHVVPTGDLMAVNGLEGATRPTVQQALAPAAVGAVIGAVVPGAGAALIAAACGLALLCSLALPTDAVTRGAERAHPLHDFVSGFRYAVRTPWILASVAFASVMGLVVSGPVQVILPATLRNQHADGASAYGLLVAALGVGGLVGSLVAGSITMPRRYLTTMIGSWALGCLPILALAVTGSLWAIGAALFVNGALTGVGMVIWGTLLQQRVPLDMIGRIASLDFLISIAFMPLSIALVGVLSEHLSAGVLFSVAGLAPLALAAVAIVAAGLHRDEIAHPLSDSTPEHQPAH
ncbi:enterobactin exporter EntS [Micromonospora sp. MW-13]|uniref:MFS transporter n=1 Tax=Micromonospora sp. MW-13 TaxID=2094022 RepID=UPI000E444312|nr:MFS transporter [Micromonospora sp. MW-13]RGC67243.1 enterobactin exporter EntS [Micromonospora sp. MW-13]